jgi:type IV pilus assembly protein PilQ
MLKKKTYILLLTFHFLFVSNTFSQNIQYTQNSIVIEEFSKISKNLNDDIRIDVTGLNFNELMTVIADEHKLNIVVDPSLNQPVVGNFYDVKVKDVLTFLADKYEVEVELNNNILSFKKRIQIKTPIIEEKVKEIDIDYRSENDFLSINLKNDSLPKVAAAITNKTGRNIIIAPEAKNLLISSYIKNRPFDQVIQMMAKSNGLMVNIDDNQFYYIEKDDTPQVSKNDSKTTNNTKKSSISLNNIILRTDGFLDIRAEEVDVESLIKEAAEKSNANYFLYSDFKDFKATLAVSQFYWKV